MMKFVFLAIFATVLLEHGQSFPLESAVNPVVPPVEAVLETVVPTKSVDDPVPPVKSEVEPVAPAKSETEPVAPAKSEIEPVEPTKIEVESVVPAKSEAEPVAPAKLVADPVEPAKSDAETVVPAKLNTDSIEPTKSKIVQVAPVEVENGPVEPAIKEDAILESSVAVQESAVETAVDVHVVPEVNFALPNIPKTFEESKYGTSRLGNIWSNRLFQYHKAGGILRDATERPQPSTILAASEILMINLVPQDAPHPLYSAEYATLTDNFILDSMSSELVDLEDKELVTPEGLTIETRTGKNLVFKKDPKTETFTVNGIVITNTHKLAGDQPIIVFDIDGILFDYKDEINAAFKTLSKTTSGLVAQPPPYSAIESSAIDEVAPKESAEAPKEEVAVVEPSHPLSPADGSEQSDVDKDK